MSDLSTEKAARKALKSAHSPAHGKPYAANRRSNGWLFTWNPASGDVPLNTHAWVVADNGAIHMVTTDREVQGMVVEALLGKWAFQAAPSGR